MRGCLICGCELVKRNQKYCNQINCQKARKRNNKRDLIMKNLRIENKQLKEDFQELKNKYITVVGRYRFDRDIGEM